MKVTIEELEAYLLDHYSNGGIAESLFMKLVEENWRSCGSPEQKSRQKII